MRHAREDYNRIQDPLGKIPQDEPVFLIRGQDKFGPATLEFYARKLRKKANKLFKHSNREKEYIAENLSDIALMVEEWAEKMVDWQSENKRKLPDLPSEDVQVGSGI